VEIQSCVTVFKIHISITLLSPDSIMKVVGTSMVLESWNFNVLREPLALNFDATMDDNSAMESVKKEGPVAVIVLHVIQSLVSS